MNKENILKLADLIEKQPHEPTGSYKTASGFSMNYLVHECGTPACIGGWACYLGGLEPSFKAAARYLGVRFGGMYSGAGDRLFFPQEIEGYSGITPAHAAAVLRNFVETSKVDWSVQP